MPWAYVDSPGTADASVVGTPVQGKRLFIINVEYTDPDEMSALSHHEGEEFIYVLDGSVEVRYGSDKYVVNQGESIYFDSIVPHNISVQAPGEKAKILAVVYTPF